MRLKYQKLLKYIFFPIVLTILVIKLYNFYNMKESDTIHSNIKQEVQQNDYVDFSKKVDGDWDNIILVNPYTNKAEIKNKYGIAANRISDFSVEYLDDRVLLIFCKGESIQNYIYWFGNVSSSEKEKLYGSIQIKREDAKFRTERTSNNNRPINLILVNE